LTRLYCTKHDSGRQHRSSESSRLLLVLFSSLHAVDTSKFCISGHVYIVYVYTCVLYSVISLDTNALNTRHAVHHFSIPTERCFACGEISKYNHESSNLIHGQSSVTGSPFSFRSSCQLRCFAEILLACSSFLCVLNATCNAPYT